ncbi:hypothetical protein K504DRAFT_297285 [Pleomassaria siparia CBS 279.74]|uniref:Secreted protein n=1 Tax=Pleomassaria siparia CBS 279.74 TaxID=1314801 RepID=A0A6G1K584_9PLEO|nr:hypothetical protein K504DRAFT_297285 [Pleomassaria siparia CBS 279.74]
MLSFSCSKRLLLLLPRIFPVRSTILFSPARHEVHKVCHRSGFVPSPKLSTAKSPIGSQLARDFVTCCVCNQFSIYPAEKSKFGCIVDSSKTGTVRSGIISRCLFGAFSSHSFSCHFVSQA